MSGDALQIYLEDHLAGAAGAVQLLEALRDQHAPEPVGRFAADILAEVEADRETLRALATRIGGGSHPVKEAAAWLAEKASRLKLSREIAGELGAFEALEALALGIHGKRALWCALAVAAPFDARLRSVDLNGLIARAESQHARVEEYRLALAPAALGPAG
jgi:hypothetical protein